jgi:hypothetical protein
MRGKVLVVLDECNFLEAFGDASNGSTLDGLRYVLGESFEGVGVTCSSFFHQTHTQ